MDKSYSGAFRLMMCRPAATSAPTSLPVISNRAISSQPRAPGFMVAAFQPTDSFHEAHLVEAIQRAARALDATGPDTSSGAGGGAPRPALGCFQVANMPMAVVAITEETIQLRVVSHGVSVNRPITWRCDSMSMIITMIGTVAGSHFAGSRMALSPITHHLTINLAGIAERLRFRFDDFVSPLARATVRVLSGTGIHIDRCSATGFPA